MWRQLLANQNVSWCEGRGPPLVVPIKGGSPLL